MSKRYIAKWFGNINVYAYNSKKSSVIQQYSTIIPFTYHRCHSCITGNTNGWYCYKYWKHIPKPKLIMPRTFTDDLQYSWLYTQGSSLLVEL